MLFKLSNLNSKLALTLGYLIPALNNSALGICWVFVTLFWKGCKCPTVGLRNGVQMPHSGTTPKLYFQ